MLRLKVLLLISTLGINTFAHTHKVPLEITKHFASTIKYLGNTAFIKRLDHKLAQIDSSEDFGTTLASPFYQKLWQEACETTGCDKQIPIKKLENKDYWWITKPDAVYINETVYNMLHLGTKRMACYELAILTKYRDDTLLRTAQLVSLPGTSILMYKGVKYLSNYSIIQIVGTSIAAAIFSTLLYEYIQINHNILIFDAAKAVKCYKCLTDTNNNRLNSIINIFRNNNCLCNFHKKNQSLNLL